MESASRQSVMAEIRRLCTIDGCPVDTTDRLEALSLLKGILAIVRRPEGARSPAWRERQSIQHWGALNTMLGASP